MPLTRASVRGLSARTPRFRSILLSRLEGFADAAGVDRDTYVEDALRRHLAGQDLVALQRQVSTRADFAFEDALELVYAERDAARAEPSPGEAAAGSQAR